MDKTENEKNLIKWTPIIEKCRSSGIGVRPWCRENNISEKQFYYWEHRIKRKVFETQKETQSQNQVNFVEIQPPIIYSIAETAKANNLKPYNYFELLLTEIPKHMEDTNLDFLEDLLPWSEKLPIECKKTK